MPFWESSTTSMAGGRGRISGTVFGAMVIGIISNGLNLIGVSSYWQLIVKGLIIACAVVRNTFSMPEPDLQTPPGRPTM